MKKTIIMAALCVASVQGYGDVTPEQVEQVLKTLKEEIPEKIRVIKNALGELETPSQRGQLIDLVLGYFVLDDICKAKNATDVLRMPWVSFICPKNQSIELRRSQCKIGCLDPEILSDVTYPPRVLYPVANRELVNLKKDWPIYATSDNLEKYNKYCIGFSKMGILSEVYLQALDHLDQDHLNEIVLPENVQDSLTYPDPAKYPFKVNGTFNEAFFKAWYENICKIYNQNKSNLNISSMKKILNSVLEKLKNIQKENKDKKDGDCISQEQKDDLVVIIEPLLEFLSDQKLSDQG